MKGSVKFVQGNEACVYGALLLALLASRLPKVGAKFIQMEWEGGCRSWKDIDWYFQVRAVKV